MFGKLKKSKRNSIVSVKDEPEWTYPLEIFEDFLESKKIKEMFETGLMNSKNQPLLAVLGEEKTGEVVTSDISQHSILVITGQSGSGSYMGMHVLLLSIMAHSKPEQVDFLLIDPQAVEFNEYQNSPFLARNVLTDIREVELYLEKICVENDRRISLLSENEMTLDEYNKAIDKGEINGGKITPLLVVIERYETLLRLTDNRISNLLKALVTNGSKKAGIHIILGDNRPNDNNFDEQLSGLISGRWVFKVSSKEASNNAMGKAGAEKLKGLGDSYFLEKGKDGAIRLQTGFVGQYEVDKIHSFLEDKYEMDRIHVVRNTFEGKV